ncbi:MAG: carbohydrate binding family 9 domain-containing protein [Gemmatimonadaceae bacterium]|nr:carbohydrate binding family 9 domain-containing protein [Gemmatimonadaceae bacterium]
MALRYDVSSVMPSLICRSAGERVLLMSALVVCVVQTEAFAQSTNGQHSVPPPVARAVEWTGAITIDGRLDDAGWASATPITNFTQFDPNEGQPGTQRTEVRFLYDSDALFVGARMYDSLGAKGVSTRLARRDQGEDADYFQIVLDSYHDHLGRAFFQINPSSVKFDALGQGGSNPDASWDPIWEGIARIDSAGWTAEMRIPLSQLRFARDSVQTWGMQIRRFVNRLNEETQWAHWSKTEAGGPPRFGHLEGIRIGARARHLEVLPYVVARSKFVRPSDANDPFQDKSEYATRVGGDVKYLLTSNLTLDATINPDFGQVEVDPAVVNLSAFETFFPERRPFFVEGAGIFSYGGFSCFFCSNVSSLGLFYSRRIGRQPQGFASGTYVDTPENTTILGAAKITGRTRNGISLGLLNAVTREERASVIDTADGSSIFRARVPVEPLSNYLVGRGRKDFRGGNLVIGGIVTSVLRRFDTLALAERLNRHAESVGTDIQLRWNERRYSFTAQLAASNIDGDSNAILRAKRSSARYFNRPDRDGGRGLDPTATSMQGLGGYARLAKDAGDWLYEGAVNFRSPGFEVNDLAFLTRSDYVWMNTNVFRYWSKPRSWYRDLSVIAGAQQQYNYDNDLIDRQFHGFLSGTATNFWRGSIFYIYRPATLEDRLTRGGPVVMRGTARTTFLNLNSDSRKRIVLSTNPTYGWNDEGGYGYSANVYATVKPASNVSFSLGPSYNRSSSPNGFVGSAAADTATDVIAKRFFGRHYIFADLVQRSLSMDTRLNVTFTPTLSLELFAQPLIASADYGNYKEFNAPRSLKKNVFQPEGGVVRRDRGTIVERGSNESSFFEIDPDGPDGPANSFTFNPSFRDFNFRSLRGNAVARWEYRPGSTLFVVWTQDRSDFVSEGDFQLGRDREALFRAHPDNVFQIKMNYHFGF